MPVSITVAAAVGPLDCAPAETPGLSPNDETARASSTQQDKPAAKPKQEAVRFIIDGRDLRPLAAGNTEATASPSEWLLDSQTCYDAAPLVAAYKTDIRASACWIVFCGWARQRHT